MLIIDGTEIAAAHQRCWGQRQVRDDQRHLSELAAEKRRGKLIASRHRLLCELPEAEPLLQSLAEQQEPLGRQVREMLTLLELNGPIVMREAIALALERKTPRAQSLAWIIGSLLKPRQRQVPPLRDLGRPAVDELQVTQHNLGDCDEI